MAAKPTDAVPPDGAADLARQGIERANAGAPDAAREVERAEAADPAAAPAAEQEAADGPGGHGLSR